ncbi:MAG: nucleotidyltransferase domain-containing protein [Gemmatimonadetes bacterium]|nr:nucleotidyltransferase domain-containing protein [Gemmatimonadota bacterium]
MTKMTLDTLVARLRAALGDGLQAVVLYGSAVGNEHHERHSDVNVLVLVKRLGSAELGSGMAAATHAWREAGNPAPLLLTVREWHGSADIFPMEYADILERHRVLHGALPTEGLVVAPRDLRLQAEHEAMGKLLQLRAGILTAGDDARRQRALLSASLSTFMVIFRAVERLHGVAPAADYDTLARAVAARAGFDAEPFVRVAEHRRGSDPLADPGPVLAGYLAGAEKLATHLDVFTIGK